ncbi:antigen identified by monoclonal antibody Ki-67 [Coemansia sp. RSA 990]|nr:antigen identified by monoclonal antibody Ki-67 [Coemansia sp. RSA 990]
MAEPKYGSLVIISRSGGDGKAFPMHNSRVVIGRKETCDIRMQKPQVSKMHCVIRAVGKDVVLRNYGENGTSINNQAVPLGKQHILKHNDVITIVGRSLRYERPPSTPPQQQQRLASLNGPQSEIIKRTIDKPLIRRQTFGGKRPSVIGSPETARRFQKWNEHYKDDPFAQGTSQNAFQQMARSVHSFGIEPSKAPDLRCRSRASPLQRTRSVGVPREHLPRPLEDSDSEVPTEPEPESDSEPKPALQTPIRSMLRQASEARKSVRFGPQLSPELFDTQAPPSTPLRRGTPMRMARGASILRQSAGVRVGLPLPVDDIFDMEGAANDSVVSLSSLPAPTPQKQPEQPEQAVDPLEALCLVPADSPVAQQTITPSRLLRADSPADTRPESPDTRPENAGEPIREIESPQMLGSPQDRRSRRRRSLRNLPPQILEESRTSSPSSPSLLVRTRKVDHNSLTPSRLFQQSPSREQRKRRRQTAPSTLWADTIGSSLAEMAKALGEDVPQMPLAKEDKVAASAEETVEEPVEEETRESEAEEHVPIPDGPTVGLAEAMQQQQQQQQPVATSSYNLIQAPDGHMPSDQAISAAIASILESSDLSTITMKQVRDELDRIFNMDLSSRREFINYTVQSMLPH